MKWKGYLIFKKKNDWSDLTARVTKNSPSLTPKEVSVKLSVDLPHELFERPTLEANISVPKESVPKSIINSEIRDNVEQIVKEVTGVNIKFTLEESKDEV